MALLGGTPQNAARPDPLSGVSNETLAAMREAFAEAWSGFLEQISDARAAGEFTALREPAHRLAGSCAFLGLPDLEHQLRALEGQCQKPDSGEDVVRSLTALDHPLGTFVTWKENAS